jgi:hypothetical protein
LFDSEQELSVPFPFHRQRGKGRDGGTERQKNTSPIIRDIRLPEEIMILFSISNVPPSGDHRNADNRGGVPVLPE